MKTERNWTTSKETMVTSEHGTDLHRTRCSITSLANTNTAGHKPKIIRARTVEWPVLDLS
jgi:hypothetical protein